MLFVIADRFAIMITIVGVAAYVVTPSRRAAEEAAPIYGVTIPDGYRDWKLISVTREKGDFNQLRAQLGNDLAIKAYREGKLPFPDGAIIVALHWKRVPSDDDNKVLARSKLSLAGPR